MKNRIKLPGAASILSLCYIYLLLATTCILAVDSIPDKDYDDDSLATGGGGEPVQNDAAAAGVDVDDKDHVVDVKFGGGYLPQMNRKMTHSYNNKSPKVLDPKLRIGKHCDLLTNPVNSNTYCTNLNLCQVVCLEGFALPNGDTNVTYACMNGQWINKRTSTNKIENCEVICNPPCLNGGVCVAPNVCQCVGRYSGPICQSEKVPCVGYPPTPIGSSKQCSPKSCVITCMNGRRFPGGRTVVNAVCKSGQWVYPDVEWTSLPNCLPVCDPPCLNGGKCVDMDVCLCPNNYRGEKCQYSIDVCDVSKLNFNGGYNCTGNKLAVSCELSCPAGMYTESELAPLYTCQYNEGVFKPPVIPQCGMRYHESMSHGQMVVTEHPYSSYRATETAILVQKPTPATCLLWGAFNFKTFNGNIFNFKSHCTFQLVSDEVTHLFHVHITLGNNTVEKLIVYIENEKYVIYKNDKNLPVLLLEKNQQVLTIPNQLPDLKVEIASGKSIMIYIPVANVYIFWNLQDLVRVDIDENLWNKTEGLCSRSGEILSGEKYYNVEKYVTKLLVPVIADKCIRPVEELSTCSREDLARAEKICQTLKTNSIFSECQNALPIDKYVEACKLTYCNSPEPERSDSICKFISMFVKSCSIEQPHLTIKWRKEYKCLVKCQPSQVYTACMPISQATCVSNEVKPNSIEKFCEEGCVCPTGTALHEDKCVKNELCPCIFRSQFYQHGHVIQKDCNQCTCMGGKWSCTDVVCKGVCIIIGDSHYKTFDGKKYNFLGKCAYNLVLTDNVTIEYDNSACGAALIGGVGAYDAVGKAGCSKSVFIRVNGKTIIKLKPAHGISVNNVDVEKLPFSKENEFYIRKSSTYLVQVSLFNGLEVFWDGTKKLIIRAAPSLQYKTKGLCGTFNKNQKDDLLTPEGDIEQDVYSFANKWRSKESCDKPDPYPLDPCEINVQSKEIASQYCSNITGALFADCHAEVDPQSYYDECMYDMCSCRSYKLAACLCPIISSYAEECSRHGISVDWRNSINNCAVHCTGGQRYELCGNSCQRSCADISRRELCKENCYEGCYCPLGYTYNDKEECIPISECPCFTKGHVYPAHYMKVYDNSTLPEVCECKNALWECKSITKQEEEQYKASHKSKCREFPNMEFSHCEPAVPVTCKNMDNPPQFSPSVCQAGCVCKEGYVLDSITKLCVKPDECPCHHGGQAYKDGDVMQEECNTCKCNKGKWDCTQKNCPGVCSSWGDTHFHTFDGRFYDFQGTCDYMFAKGHLSDTESFQIIIEIVPCGTGGTSCAKSVTLNVHSGLDKESITFVKDKDIPDTKSYKTILVFHAGLQVVATVPSLAITLQWDRGTRVGIQVEPKWSKKISGLCGNFDGDSSNDFQTPSGGLTEVSPLLFADSWKLQQHCPVPPPIQDPCELHPFRKVWAVEKCSLLKVSPIFKQCHSEVPIHEYINRCIFDSCACDQGGDCECVCTVFAAYGQECAARGVPIKWRRPDICPIQCDSGSEYSANITACPDKTCDNLLDYENNYGLCHELPCVEGCEKKGCPPGQIYRNSSSTECINMNNCVCMNIDGIIYYENDVIDEDSCHKCTCSKGKKVCTGVPCSPTETVTVPTISTETVTPFYDEQSCVDGWTDWIAVDEPLAGSSDIAAYIFHVYNEKLAETNNRSQEAICTEDHLSNITCQYKKKGQQNFKDFACTLNDTISCIGDCEQMRLKALCDCDVLTPLHSFGLIHQPPPQVPGVCTSFWTNWIDAANIKTGLYEPLTAETKEHLCPQGYYIENIDCAYIKPAKSSKKVHPSMAKLKPKKADPAQINWLHTDDVDVVCNKSVGLVCDNGKQKRGKCRSYKIKVQCGCVTEVTQIPGTPSPSWPLVFQTPPCPPGGVRTSCKVKCNQVCLYYHDLLLKNQTQCPSNDSCIAGCVPKENKDEPCPPGKYWRDDNTCVAIEDCTCATNNGSIAKPGDLNYESECELCQCINNQYICKNICTLTTPILSSTTTSPYQPSSITEVETTTLTTFYPGIVTTTSTSTEPSTVTYTPPAATIELTTGSTPTTTIYDTSTTSETAPPATETHSTTPEITQTPTALITPALTPSPSYETYTPYEVTGISTTSSTIGAVIIVPPPTDVTPPVQCDSKKYAPLEIVQYDASSSSSPQNGPENAKLDSDDHNVVNKTIWRAAISNKQQFLDLNLGSPQPIYGVTIAGSSNLNEYVERFNVLYSTDGVAYSFIEYNGKHVVFDGLHSKYGLATRIFDVPIEARHIRIAPISWNNWISLQVRVLGCSIGEPAVPTPVCSEPMGLDSGRMSPQQVKVSSASSPQFKVTDASLSSTSAWVPFTASTNQWIQFDFLDRRVITGITTKGIKDVGHVGEARVEAYKVYYSHDGQNWNPVVDDHLEAKVFNGNNDSFNAYTNFFTTPLEATYLRVYPVKWYNVPALKIEVLGCYEPYPTPTIPTTPEVTPPVVWSSSTETPSTMFTEPETTTSPSTEAPCEVCEGVARPSTCHCHSGKLWDGEKCTAQATCPCIVGTMKYAVGLSYLTEDCQKCTCVLGGMSDCKPQECPPCGPEQKRDLTKNCSCTCTPCPQHTRLCRTSNICINESLWCNGYKDCPDDETGCPTNVTIITSTTIVQFPPPTPVPCPEAKCPPGYYPVYATHSSVKAPVKGKTTKKTVTINKTSPSQSININIVNAGGSSGKIPADSYTATLLQQALAHSGTVKGKKTVKTHGYKGKKTVEITVSEYTKKLEEQRQSIPVQECPEWRCESNVTECSKPVCPANTQLKAVYTDEKCPSYDCVPPPSMERVCDVDGKLFKTFDGLSYKADICDHVLAKDKNYDTWSVRKLYKCPYIGQCAPSLVIDHTDDVIELFSNFSTKYNGYPYTVTQLQNIGNRSGSFVIRTMSTAFIIFTSTQLDFSVVWSSSGNVKIIVDSSLQGMVYGLCGYFDNNVKTDKMKPDGTLSGTTQDFVNAWKHDSSVCEVKICPIDIQTKAAAMCSAIKESPLDSCGFTQNLDEQVAKCIESVCVCAETTADIHGKCRCDSLQRFVTTCSLAQQGVDLSLWRMKFDCAVNCSSSLVYQDCYNRQCEPSCYSLLHKDECVRVPDVCYPGCYCPEGLLRDGNTCIKPTSCRDCGCEGNGITQYTTFDQLDVPLDNPCESFVLVRTTKLFNSYKPGFSIVITNGKCTSDALGPVCQHGLTITAESTEILLMQSNSTNEIIVQVNQISVNSFPYNKNGITMNESPGTSVTLTIKSLELDVTFATMNRGFSIRLPSYIYTDKTEGLCGRCNGKQEDDILNPDGKVPQSADEFTDGWQTKDTADTTVETCFIEEMPNTTCVPPKTEEDICMFLQNKESFEPCHALVDVGKYVQQCHDMMCSGQDGSYCHSLEAYAKECQKVGICLNWRTRDLCPYTCPKDFVYEACSLSCDVTCDNYRAVLEDKSVCPEPLTEKCVCPPGQVILNGSCIIENRCQPCDKFGHYVGDKWKQDNCTMCVCLEDGNVQCQKKQCPSEPVCPRDYEVVIDVHNDDPCCNKYECKFKPKIFNCTEVAKPACGKDQVLKVELTPENCTTYYCVCIPLEQCPKPEPIDESKLLPGMVKVEVTEGCCPSVTIKCQNDTCPPPKKCPPFYVLSESKNLGDCCYKYECVIPPRSCIYQYQWIASQNGGERKRTENELYAEIKTFGDTWVDGPCRQCICNEEMPRATCTALKCPAPPDNPDFITKPAYHYGSCCPTYKNVACKVGSTVYQVGSIWPVEEQPCVNQSCTGNAETGVIMLQEIIHSCDTNCKPGWKYIHPADPKKECCGSCQQVSCIDEKGELHPAESTWKSADNCTEYECDKKLQIISSTELCPNITGCNPEDIRQQGCCKICVPQPKSFVTCDAEPIPVNETDRLIRKDVEGHSGCFNKASTGFTRCRGLCDNFEWYNDETTRYGAVCKCCVGLKYRKKNVQMTCTDKHTFYHTVEIPIACGCQECGGNLPTKPSPFSASSRYPFSLATSRPKSKKS